MGLTREIGDPGEKGDKGEQGESGPRGPRGEQVWIYDSMVAGYGYGLLLLYHALYKMSWATPLATVVAVATANNIALFFSGLLLNIKRYSLLWT